VYYVNMLIWSLNSVGFERHRDLDCCFNSYQFHQQICTHEKRDIKASLKISRKIDVKENALYYYYLLNMDLLHMNDNIVMLNCMTVCDYVIIVDSLFSYP
jgi:hypothetical protein